MRVIIGMVAIGASLAGCNGTLDMPAGPNGAFEDGGVGDGFDAGLMTVDGSIVDGDGSVVVRLGDDPLEVPAQRIWRLTPTQYVNSFVAAFGSTVVEVDDFGPDPWAYGFRNIAEQNNVDTRWAIEVNRNAKETAQKIALAAETERPCLFDATPGDACIRGFVSGYVDAAFRRPARAAELDALVGLFRDVRANDEASVAVAAMIEAIAQSPLFLYRRELGDDSGDGQELVALGHYEIASELSYLFVDGPPDQPLYADAEAGMLSDRDVVREHAERLLRTDAGKRKVGTFFDEYLNTFELERGGVDKDPDFFPDLSVEVQAALHRETRTFVERLLIDGDGTLLDLFGSDQTFYDDVVASFYGWPAPSEAGAVMMTMDGRRGVFQQGAFLTAGSGPASSDPLHRGLFIYEKLLCKHIMPPPDLNLDELGDKLTPKDPDATERESLAWLKETSPQCWGCHNLFVPLGLSLENFDAVGVFRTQQNERELDPSGELAQGLESDGYYADGAELLRRIASSASGQACFAQQWMRFSFGGEYDVPVTAAMVKRFRESQLGIVDLLLAFVTDDAFYVRRVEEVQ